MSEVNLYYQQLEEQSDENYIKVIRCKECKFFINSVSECSSHRGMVVADPEGYCSHAETKQKTVRFLLNGCDISFIAEAPASITLEQLLQQADRIKPEWCACGVCSLPDYLSNSEPEIVFTYTDVRKTSEDVPCDIQKEIF